jgi:hypothetical protein
MANRDRTNKRPTAPKPVRQASRTAGLSLEELANAIMAGQPEPPTPPEAEGMLDRLIETEREVSPGIDDDALVSIVNERVRELVSAGNPYVAPLSELLLNDFVANRARVQIALMGTRWHPSPPVVPKQARKDAIASTVLELTGWQAVPEETVEAIYCWLFGDEARYMHGAELRMAAGQRIMANPRLGAVQLVDPRIGKPVLVTREEIRDHAETDLAVMLAAHEYADQQLQYHARAQRLLEPYARDGMKVGDVVLAAAREHGIDPAGRSTEDLVDVVLAAIEADRFGTEVDVPTETE